MGREQTRTKKKLDCQQTNSILLQKRFHSQLSLLHNIVENLNLVLQDGFLENGARKLRPLFLLRNLLLHLLLLSMTVRIALMELQVALRYEVQLALWTHKRLSSDEFPESSLLLDMLLLDARQFLALFPQRLQSERNRERTRIRHWTTRFGMSFTFSRLSR